ncbi:S41 family peptidase [Verrucomicrobiota bacterium sgz303538]
MRAITRREALALLTSLTAAQFAHGQTPATNYAADVEFLLTEFERQAGHFFKTKGIDWKAVSDRFRAEVQQVHDDAAHVKLCNRLIAQLRDGHAGITRLNKVQMPDESQGRRFTGPRVHLVLIGERVFVRQAFGSATEAGITPGMEVESIDDTPIRKWLEAAVQRLSEDNGYSTPHTALYYACHTGLADWEGKPIAFGLLQDGQKKSITLTRTGGPNFVPIGPVFPPKDIKTVGRQSYGRTAAGYGYIHLRDVPGDLQNQIDKMLSEIGDVPGMILDTRANGGGGCDHEAVFGRFVPNGKRWRQYTGAGTKPFTGPMVVIVDAGVRSAGETVAGMFKEDGRALMIGDTPTAGMSSQKAMLTVPSGLFSLRFSVASNKGRFNGGRGIEGIGVPPHEITPYDPADLKSGVDTQIRRAEEYLKAGLPGDKVAWNPVML